MAHAARAQCQLIPAESGNGILKPHGAIAYQTVVLGSSPPARTDTTFGTACRAPRNGFTLLALAHHFEAQPARHRRDLDETHFDGVAELIGFAAPLADQRMALL